MVDQEAYDESGDLTLTCPKCGSAMERGFIPDRIDVRYALLREWVAGVAQERFFGGVKLKGKERYYVLTFRCPDCYYLESYAKYPVG
jgi:predicted RNA-binding Zn-ribbon protein involved in translation (DUF1610 family)